MIAVVETVTGTFAVDLDTDDVTACDDEVEVAPPPVLNLPRVVAAAANGATVFAVVAAKPPILVSHDSGTTWRGSGRGLPPGTAVAIADDDPDVALYAARNRLFLTRDGGVFWTALAVELPVIVAVAFRT